MEFFPFCSLALLLFYIFFVADLRTGAVAKSFKPGKYDRNSTYLNVFIAMILNIIPWLFREGIIPIEFGLVSMDNFTKSLLLFVMVLGCCLRAWSMKVLGEFFTRTLTYQAGQKVIQSGPYKLLRHPGYLGNLLCILPYSLLVSSNLLVGALTFLIFLLTWNNRMTKEEEMMIQNVGKEYQDYMKKTWRLFPYIY